jgi:hypothetical protein
VRTPLRDAAGGVVVPAAVLALLVILGYDPGVLIETLRGEERAAGLAWLLLPLFALGAGAARALGAGVRASVAAAFAALVLAAATGLFAGGPPRTLYGFAAAGTVVSVAGLLLFGAEYALRHPDRLRRAVSPVTLRRALLAGVAHAVLLLAVRGSVLLSMWGTGAARLGVLLGGFGALVLAWTALGAVLLGTAPAYLALRSRLVTPALAVVALSAYAAATTVVEELTRQATGAVPAAAMTPVTAYLVGWFAPLALALLLGAVEYRLRERLGVFPPRPVRAERAGE